MGLLLIDFLFLVKLWGKNVHQQALFQVYGLRLTRQNGRYLLNGLTIGLLFCLGLFVVEALLGWVEFTQPTGVFLIIVGEGLLSALAIALAEELVFRGWLLDELERDYGKKTGLITSAVIFALLHFLKPISEIMRTFPTFPALVLLGLTLVWAKRKYKGNLGICIGLHGGLVWGYYILNVGQLVQYSGSVSPWITGIDGNPIAGGMGLFFLGVLAFWMARKRSVK